MDGGFPAGYSRICRAAADACRPVCHCEPVRTLARRSVFLKTARQGCRALWMAGISAAGRCAWRADDIRPYSLSPSHGGVIARRGRCPHRPAVPAPSVIASQCAHWRGNPFSQKTNAPVSQETKARTSAVPLSLLRACRNHSKAGNGASRARLLCSAGRSEVIFASPPVRLAPNGGSLCRGGMGTCPHHSIFR